MFPALDLTPWATREVPGFMLIFKDDLGYYVANPSWSRGKSEKGDDITMVQMEILGPWWWWM